MSVKLRAMHKLRDHLPAADERLFEFFGAWLDARKDGLVPLRKDFSPTRIAHLLPFIWIYQYDPEVGDFVCHLAGENVNDAWGQGLKGRTLRDIVGQKDFEMVRERWRHIVNDPAIQHGSEKEKMTALKVWRAERLLLPMASADGQINVVLGLSLYNLENRSLMEGGSVPELVRRFPCEDFR